MQKKQIKLESDIQKCISRKYKLEVQLEYLDKIIYDLQLKKGALLSDMVKCKSELEKLISEKDDKH